MTSQTPIVAVRIPANVSRILVVEGPEDKTFFHALAEHLGIEQQIYVVVCNGKNKLATTLKSILNDGNFHNFDHIGIICDNDFPESREHKRALETIQDEIISANEGINDNLQKTRELPKPVRARVAAGTRPKVSVLLLPDDNRDGMLENLVLDAIGKNEITECTDAFYDCLEQQAKLEIQEAREPRSRLSVYISGKIVDTKYATNDDSRRWFLTQAVDMKWWQEEDMWNKPAFDDAKAFLTQLLAN